MRIDELAFVHVNCKTVMCEEVSSEDGLLYLSDEENPRERASQTKVESQGALAVGLT